jgi:hypothetical protein
VRQDGIVKELPMTTPAVADMVSRAVTLEDFLARLQEHNPFVDNRVTGPTAEDVDVEALNQGAFRRLIDLATESLHARRGLGTVLWGQAGIGKSHLLARLVRWAGAGNACLVYLHNLQASPGNLPRALLRAVVGSLTWVEGRGYHTTPLFRMAHATLQETVGRGIFHSWGNLERAFVQALSQHAPGRDADAALADRTVQEVLFRFYRSVFRTGHGKEDGTAASHAIQWLRGDALSPAQGECLGLPPGRRRDDPVLLEDNQQIKQALVSLTALAACRRLPFLLAFDQVDNLDTEQFAALARFLEALIDSSQNLLVVTAGIQNSLIEWRDRRVVQESAWDRLAQFQVPLQRISPEQASPLLALRLQRFLEPFDEVPGVRQMVFEDPLFPLGSAWFKGIMKDRVEVRPRDVINEAREAWYREQQALRHMGGPAWVNSWKTQHANGTIFEEVSVLLSGEEASDGDWSRQRLQEEIDRFVEERMEDYRRAAASALPHPDSVSESVAQLLAHCYDLGESYGLFGVERLEKSKSGAPPTYNLQVRQRGPQPGTEIRTGLVFTPANNAWAMFHVLDRLREDTAPPQRILLVTHEDSFDLGSKGEEYLAILTRREGTELSVLRLPLEDFTTIDALHAVWNLAKSEDLELRLPDGTDRLITAAEVEVSHHRCGRYRAAPVLSAVLEIPPTVQAVPHQGETLSERTSQLSPPTLSEIILGEE